MRLVIVGKKIPATGSQQSNGALGDAIRGTVNRALQGARAELQRNINELTSQRADLQIDLIAATASGSRDERLTVQAKLDRLDAQLREATDALAKLETGVDQTSPDRIGTPVVGTPPAFPNFPPTTRVDPTEIIATSLGILFVAFPLTLAIVRYIWKRSTTAPAPALSQEQTRRFDRLEQSVDAIAIEVERISESQRYLTKLLAEPKKQGLGTGV
jgi:hypothetical protein